MKKVLFILSMLTLWLGGMAQQKITLEEARTICAKQMAAFTTAVAPAYKAGTTFDQFKTAVCGSWRPLPEGTNQLRAAYNRLVKGTRSDEIVRAYSGKEIAESMKVLYDLNKRGIKSDGAELVGGITGVDNNAFGRAAGPECRWYQFWCLVHGFADWVVDNWQAIAEIINYILHL